LKKKELSEKDKDKLKELSAKNKGTGKAILLNNSLEEIKNISVRSMGSSLRKLREKPSVIVMDGTATGSIIKTVEEIGSQTLVAQNFTTTDTSLELLSF